MTLGTRYWLGLGIGMTLTLSAGPLWAQNLIIGSATEPSAIDPHFARSGNNQNIAQQVFDRLASIDENLQQHPAIAES